MRYLTLCGRFSREAFCHLPADDPFDVERLVSVGERERWTAADEPAVYLAGDVGVALAELGRHAPALPPDRRIERRRIVRVRVSLERVLDLTRRETLEALRVSGAPWAFTDPARAREIAAAARASGDCDAILVPSVAFLDQADRWNVVIFADRLDGGIRAAIEDPMDVGLVEIGQDPRR